MIAAFPMSGSVTRTWTVPMAVMRRNVVRRRRETNRQTWTERQQKRGGGLISKERKRERTDMVLSRMTSSRIYNFSGYILLVILSVNMGEIPCHHSVQVYSQNMSEVSWS